jgi:O-antigen/teichoic acid export membrane protein
MNDMLTSPAVYYARCNKLILVRSNASSKDYGATSVTSGRTRRLLEGAFATMLGKGVVLAVNAISIPIVVHYGAERFGVWVTISTALSMLLLLDLGVANSLTNSSAPGASGAAVPTQELLLLMCVWVMLSTFMSNTAIVLVAKGKTQLLAWCGLAATVLNIGLSICWVGRIGAPGIILGTIVSYLFVLVIPQTMSRYHVLRERN